MVTTLLFSIYNLSLLQVKLKTLNNESWYGLFCDVKIVRVFNILYLRKVRFANKNNLHQKMVGNSVRSQF
ncbi:hypothetical protein SAMN05216464_111189 [Mucilaginibacter pineti]|uniref:Uncharacterized protein n=1 Tax=Mucilaginibacter pineti TaxID=1391627 RepID=A0A1G7HE34_9SPHI|nr:hypothetical protein SAMN05216464_111189 [Mucilaginibacter pineti]